MYQARVVDEELRARLGATGAVVIEGPKAVGKTATARQVAHSEVLLDVDAAAQRAIEVDPSLVLAGEAPRLIDEWQLAPILWNHIRRAIDDGNAPGRFILTGSAVPADDVTRHSGAGRIGRLRMRPMSLFESGYSTGEISLASLFDGETARSPEPALSVNDLVQRLAIGGWPGLIGVNVDPALRLVRDYLDEIRRIDVGRIDETRRDAQKVGRVLRALARHTSTYAAATTIAADAGGGDGSLDDETVRAYVSVLERLMVIEDQPPWAPHLRSRSTLRRASKRHFVDPSLAVAALRATPPRLLDDLALTGFLFESAVVRDLRVYAQAIDGQVLQYRDNTGLEVDAIVEADGAWGAFEIKLGQGRLEEAAATLKRFASRIDVEQTGPPAVLGVIVATGYGYVREDGIAVIPIGALGP